MQTSIDELMRIIGESEVEKRLLRAELLATQAKCQALEAQIAATAATPSDPPQA